MARIYLGRVGLDRWVMWGTCVHGARPLWRDKRKRPAYGLNDVNDLPPTSPLRHPGHAHTLIDPLVFGEESRIVARCAGAVASDGEVWVERKSRLGGGP